MALTSSSVFTLMQIECRWDHGTPTGISWRLDDASETIGRLEFGYSLELWDSNNADFASVARYLCIYCWFFGC